MLKVIKGYPAPASIPAGIALFLFGLFEVFTVYVNLHTLTNPQRIVAMLITFSALTGGIADLWGFRHFRRNGLPSADTNSAQYVNVGQLHLASGFGLVLGLTLHIVLGFTGVVGIWYVWLLLILSGFNGIIDGIQYLQWGAPQNMRSVSKDDY